jgi:hypothetical protein
MPTLLSNKFLCGKKWTKMYFISIYRRHICAFPERHIYAAVINFVLYLLYQAIAHQNCMWSKAVQNGYSISVSCSIILKMKLCDIKLYSMILHHCMYGLVEHAVPGDDCLYCTTEIRNKTKGDKWMIMKIMYCNCKQRSKQLDCLYQA